MNIDTSDKIEKQIVLKAPIARVFRALTDTREFGEWFKVRLHGKFEVGATIRGNVTHPGYEHVPFTATVERLEAPHFFAYRWHPHAIDAAIDYSSEPTTLVSFELSEVPEGTLLRVTESGFDHIPIARRAEAYRGNSGGWAQQCSNIEAYLAQAR
jgi:uncharacterized protein YndB with AHSA1/START domain